MQNRGDDRTDSTLPLRVEQDPEAWRAEARRFSNLVWISLVIVIVAAVFDFAFDLVGLIWAGLVIGGLFAFVFALLARRASRRHVSTDPWLFTVHQDGLEYPKLGILPWSEIDHLHLIVRGADPELRAADPSVEQVHFSVYIADPDTSNERLTAEGLEPRFNRMFTDVFRDGTRTIPPASRWIGVVTEIAQRHEVAVRRD